MKYELGATTTAKLPDLNSCTARSLVKNIGLSPSLARNIIGYKRRKGRYDHVGELWKLEKMTLPIFEFICSNYTVYDLPKRRKSQNKTKTVTHKSAKGEAQIGKGRKRAQGSRQTEEQFPVLERESAAPAEVGLFPPSHITMNPVAVATSASGNALMVTYRAVKPGKHTPGKSSENTSKNSTGTVQTNSKPPGGENKKDFDSKRVGGEPADATLTVARVKSTEAVLNKPTRLKSIEKWISDVKEAGPSGVRADDMESESMNRGSKSQTNKSTSEKRNDAESFKAKEGSKSLEKSNDAKSDTKKHEYLQEHLNLRPIDRGTVGAEKGGSEKIKKDDSHGKAGAEEVSQKISRGNALVEDDAIPGPSGVKAEDIHRKRASRSEVTKQPSKTGEREITESVKGGKEALSSHRHDRHKHHHHRHSKDKTKEDGKKGDRSDQKEHQQSGDKHHRSHDKHHRSRDKHHKSHDKDHDKHKRSHDKSGNSDDNKDSSCLIM